MGSLQQFCSTGSEDSFNKSGLVVIILGNILHKKSVKSKIPSHYYKEQSNLKYLPIVKISMCL